MGQENIATWNCAKKLTEVEVREVYMYASRD